MPWLFSNNRTPLPQNFRLSTRPVPPRETPNGRLRSFSSRRFITLALELDVISAPEFIHHPVVYNNPSIKKWCRKNFRQLPSLIERALQWRDNQRTQSLAIELRETGREPTTPQRLAIVALDTRIELAQGGNEIRDGEELSDRRVAQYLRDENHTVDQALDLIFPKPRIYDTPRSLGSYVR